MRLRFKGQSLVIDILLIAALAAAGPIPAFATETHQFDVPAEDAQSAIRDFASQAHVQILVDGENVKDKHFHAVSGVLSTDQGLRLLLADSDLSPQYVGDRSVALVTKRDTENSQSKSGVSDAAKEGKKSSSQDFRVAQVDPGQTTGIVPIIKDSGTSESDKSQLTEIIVTAQKREERLQDVPISIVVIGADELQKRNIVSIDDLATVVPGLLVQSVGNQRRITLRGISNVTFGNFASQIGMYEDDANITSTATNQLTVNTYDLQRVEVLRGPQGTLYGEGSMGGTLRFITNNPLLDRFDARSEMSALFTEAGAPSQRIDAMVNVPLINDSLAIRVAGAFDHEGGWVDQPAASLRDINEQNNTDVRTKVLWTPLQGLTVNTLVELYRSSSAPGTGEDANGNYTQPFNQTTTPHIDDSHNIFNLTAAYEMGWARLLNSATYFSQDNIRTNGGYFIPIAPPPATPLSILDPRSEQPQTSTNNELRLTSADTGPWNWTLGGVYRNFHYSLEQLPPYVGFTGSPGTGLPAPLASAFDYRGASTSWAAFADTSYLISGVVTVGAGVRSYHDTEYYNSGGEQSASFQSVDPRFYVNWKINERLNAYASAAKGFRSGGFNAVQQTGFAPESVWTYEVGSKGIAPDIGMTFAADLFYSNYKNYVVAGIPLDNPLVNDYQNAGSALIKGVEFDSQWQLPGGWTLGVNGDFLDAYFTSIELQPASSPYLLGDHLDLVPKYQGTVTFQRDFAFQGHKGYVLADYGIQGRSTYRNRSIGDWYFSESDVIHMLDLKVGLQWSDNLSLQIFAQNILNDRGYTTPVVIEGAADRARPRTYGVSFIFGL